VIHAELYRQWSGMPASAALQPGWELHAYPSAGTPVALAATSGHEIHFASDPATRGHLITRSRISEFLGPLLEDKAFLITRVPVAPEFAPQRRFVERMGFDLVGDDGAFHNYMLSALPFGLHTGA
jgi:hypothetical protein